MTLSPKDPRPFNGEFEGASVVSVDQFTSRDELEAIFHVADLMRPRVRAQIQGTELRDSTIAILFYQPSTRTFGSFKMAATWLGSQRILDIHEMAQFSSAVKGESLEDTIRTIEEISGANLIILRHPADDSSAIAASAASVPVINAGSGTREHPTQAILDLYTIRQELKGMDGLHVAMLGDLKYGRTIKSLARLLALAGSGNQISFVSPEALKAPPELVVELKRKGVFVYETENLASVLPSVDVLYVTRLQKEWFEASGQMELYNQLKGAYDITPEVMKQAKEKMIVMHPLPRVGEIAYEVDSDPRAAYFRQMRNGLYTRMALLALVLGKA